MKKFLLLLAVFTSLLSLSCTKDNDDDTNRRSENLKSLEIGDYVMQVPQEFTLEEGSGFDSYIGTINGNGIEIRFDYGSWNVPPRDLDPAKYEVKFETFGSVERYIVIPEDPKDRTGIHIRDLNNVQHGNYVSLQMAAENLSKDEQDLVLKILESVHLMN